MRACFTLMWLMLFGIKLTAADATNSKYCFQFTWLGSMYDNHSTVNINCTTYEGVPCFEPLVITGDSTQPNVTYMWDTLNHTNISCPLRLGYTCIKYTFIYNNAVINSTHFCGKMIESTTKAVTRGCFSHKSNGYTVETCACQSVPGEMPCNSSKRTEIEMPLVLMVGLVMLYHYVMVGNTVD